jgi:hypothetical protein
MAFEKAVNIALMVSPLSRVGFHFQIVAVILCDTGIALLAYMDGINGSPTLGGVVLAASAAACSAIYKVRLTQSFLSKLY